MALAARPAAPKPRRSWLYQGLGVLLLIGLWYLVTDVLHVWPPYVIPGPDKVWEEIRYGIAGPGPGDGKLLMAVGSSLRRVALGYLIALCLGLAFGLVLASLRVLRETLGSYLTAIQSIPSIAFVPLAILVFGLNERAVLFVVVLEGFIPVALGVSSALLNVPPAWRVAGRTLGAGGLGMIFKVTLPASLPQAVTSLRTAWSFSWRALIGAELLTSNPGLGQLLETGRNTANMAMVLATIIIVGVVGGLFDALIRAIEARLRRDYGLEVAT